MKFLTLDENGNQKLVEAPTGGGAANVNNPNYIINGNFGLWQRKPFFRTDFNNSLDSDFYADRFYYQIIGSSALLNENSLDPRNTDTPTVSQSGIFSEYSLFSKITTASTTSNKGIYIGYTVENIDFRNLYKRKATLSFWTKNSNAGVYAVCIKANNATNAYCVKTYTVNQANTWEFKTITFDFDNVLVTKPASDQGEKGIVINWVIESNLIATSSEWSNTKAYTLAGVNNMTDIAGNEFRLAQVQLVEGETANQIYQYYGGSVESDMLGCFRYFESSQSSWARVPENGNWQDAIIANIGTFNNKYGQMIAYLNFDFKVKKATQPTTKIFSPINANFKCANFTTYANADNSKIYFEAQGENSFTLVLYDDTYWNNNKTIAFHWTADAEI